MLLFLAPMDWITDTATRQITKQIFEKYPLPWFELAFVTEFVSADWFFHNPEKVQNHLIFEETEKPIIAQIFGANLKTLLYTAKFIDKNYNFDWIQLNIWCPAPKIVRQWAGSALMINKQKTLEIIKTLSISIKKPFSIKTRTWLNEADKQAQFDFLVKSSKYCDMIVVHGRTFPQQNSWPVDLDYVLKLKQKVWNRCKIVFNWWIQNWWYNDKDFLEKIQILDWIMIWQTAIWNPWVFVNHNPNWEEKKQTIIKHLQLYIKYKQEGRWIREFRKFVSGYIKWIPNASKYRDKLIRTTSFKEFVNILEWI